MENKILEAIQGLNARFDNLETRFDSLESQVKENTQILKALEHAAEVNKAEHDKMFFNMAEITGSVKATEAEVKEIRADMSKLEFVTANNYADIAKLKLVR